MTFPQCTNNVIRPILCITLHSNIAVFHIATHRLLSFYIEERPIFDAGADGVAGAVFRDTQPLRQLRKQTSVPHCVIGGCNRSSQIQVFLEAVFNMLSVL